MNEYYVMEGNKRVSILKYVDAYSAEGEVTRLVPKRDETDFNNIIYYEFLGFNNKKGINDIWFDILVTHVPKTWVLIYPCFLIH